MNTFDDKQFHKRFREHAKLVGSWVRHPKTVGGIAPSGKVLSARMASVIRPQSSLPVLELGPGTGVFTQAILAQGLAPEKLYAVEYSKTFTVALQRRFPDAHIFEGNAFDIKKLAKRWGIEQFDCAISGLPLLNFPLLQRARFVRDVLDLIAPGRPLIQFSYGPKPPTPAISRHYRIKPAGTILRNLPPARVWKYYHI